jgi:hypothetical protein
MTCKECLAALETESLREMTPDSPVMQHCARCPDCARVTTMLRDKEYETATVLNTLPPMSSPLIVAETAVRTAQRRLVGRVAVMLSGAALVVTLLIVAVTIVYPAFEDGDTRVSAVRTETMQLSCLSPQQAGDIINPYIEGKYYIPRSGISAITVTATPKELAKARSLIREFESDPSAACRLPMTIIQNVRKQMSEGQGPNPVPEADPATGKAPTSLLGKKTGESLLDPKSPIGSGPVLAPDKVTVPPKK